MATKLFRKIANTKRGVSYVLSALILTLITFAIGSGMYYWYSSVQLEQQGTAEQSQEQLLGALGACISVTNINYDSLTNQSDIVFKNCGNSNLDIGDEKIKDIGVLRAPSMDSCSFSLNSTTCVGCPLTLKPKSSRLIVLNWSMERACTQRIAKGIKHQITFYIDRLSTTSGVFTPRDIVTTFSRVATESNPGSSSATCGVSITNNSALLSEQTFTPGITKSFCFNFTITNTGNQPDSFSLANATTSDSSVSCKGAFLIDQSLAGATNTCNAASGGLIRASNGPSDPVITLESGGTKVILINSTIAGPVAASFCFGGLGVTSNNCNTQNTNVQFNLSIS